MHFVFVATSGNNTIFEVSSIVGGSYICLNGQKWEIWTDTLGNYHTHNRQKIILHEVRLHPHRVWLKIKKIRTPDNWNLGIVLFFGVFQCLVKPEVTLVKSSLCEKRFFPHEVNKSDRVI